MPLDAVRHGLYAAAPAGSEQAGRVQARGGGATQNVVAKDGRPAEKVSSQKKAQSSQNGRAHERMSSQKPEPKNFATTEGKRGKFATADLGSYGSESVLPYQGVSRDEWRIIFRILPPKKDGSQTISFYYKGRTSYVNKAGKRVVPYLPGGKITRDGTKRELQAYKGRSTADN